MERPANDPAENDREVGGALECYFGSLIGEDAGDEALLKEVAEGCWDSEEKAKIVAEQMAHHPGGRWMVVALEGSPRRWGVRRE